jgi:hypothetical protein
MSDGKVANDKKKVFRIKGIPSPTSAIKRERWGCKRTNLI